jgi:hypothetical protein
VPQTIQTTVYTFDELTDAAKEKAREWLRSGFDFDFAAENVLEDAATVARLLGITLDTHNGCGIAYSGFSSQGDGASFSGTYRYMAGSAKLVRAHAPLDTRLHKIADDLTTIQRRHFYSLAAKVVTSGYYSHSGTMSLEWCVTGRVHEIDAPDDVSSALLGFLRDFADWVYRQLDAEYTYQTSDEAVDENMRANEYTFTAEGRRFV